MKGLEALERIGAEKLARGELIRNDGKVEPYYKTIEKELKAFDIIKKYAVNDGWSNGWVIKFWDMNNKELDLVNEVLK